MTNINTEYLNKMIDYDKVATINRPATAVLFVSPSGDGTDGSTWDKAYTTIQSALNACSTDADAHTVIYLSPIATFYDIDTAGDPTWSCNVSIIGSHRRWSPIRNTHASATSIMNFSGKISLENMAISQTDCVDGIVITSSAFRIRRCGFNSSTCSSAVTSIKIDGTSADIMGGIIEDVKVIGDDTYSTGIELINCNTNDFLHLHLHGCLEGINISGANSTNNIFENLDIGLCATGIKVVAGTGEHFYSVDFHGNTLNIDDPMDSNVWRDINGEFPIITEPDNFSGVAVNTGDGANVWTASPVEVRASATSTKPFSIVGINLDAGTNEKYRIRLSADNGVTWFDDIQVEDARNTTLAFPSGTAFIFNAGTQITAQSKSESGGVDTLDIWLKVQEI